MDFKIDSKDLQNFTLSLQKINDVALPIAIQNTFNTVALDVKKRTLLEMANKHFDVKRIGFFKANSAAKRHKAKDFNYNYNKVKAEVGITKGKKANEKATEQLGYQQTATSIKRSANPLGDKPQSKKTIDILSKKPEIFVYESKESFKSSNYIRTIARAKRRNAGFLVTSKQKSGRGAIHEVKTFRKRKPTKSNRRRFVIKTKALASYKPGGYVKLKTKEPFLNNASLKSQKELMVKTYIKEAEKQVKLAIKRK